MKRLVYTIVLSAALGAVIAQAQNNNAAAGQAEFPLAAPAGTDSGAMKNPLPGGVNTGIPDERTWKYGPDYSPKAGSKIWNPVMAKMKAGGKVTGGTLSAAVDPVTYCAMANAGYDFIWTEMQHSPHDWDQVAKMWAGCPHAKAVPGARVPYANEREIQHAVDEGALVVVVPTVRSVQEAIDARDWTFYPPLGRRSQGGTSLWNDVPGGYRETANDNIVLILMIETVDGVKDAYEIAKVPGVTAVFAASGDLGNFSGYKQGTPDYERLINVVHDAAISAGKRLCGPFAWKNRPDFTCFQAGSELTNIAKGASDELGPLKNTQGKVEVGPYAPKN